jgi:hypothetical protein
MLDATQWSKSNEKFILKLRDHIIRESLLAGKHIIVDDTNLNPIHVARMKEIAQEVGNTVVKVRDFTDVPLEECIERDKGRPNSVGEEVIRRMHRDFLAPTVVKKPHNPSLPNCYIFDIDGTLALKGDRSAYDWSRVSEDKPNTDVINIYSTLANAGFPIIIFSGRDEVCREATEKWLLDNGINDYALLAMRAEGNMEKDTIVKEALYRAYLDGRYNVLGVFDDRNSVVQAWRSLGLTCFQVAEGDF